MTSSFTITIHSVVLDKKPCSPPLSPTSSPPTSPSSPPSSTTSPPSSTVEKKNKKRRGSGIFKSFGKSKGKGNEEGGEKGAAEAEAKYEARIVVMNNASGEVIEKGKLEVREHLLDECDKLAHVCSYIYFVSSSVQTVLGPVSGLYPSAHTLNIFHLLLAHTQCKTANPNQKTPKN